MATEKKPAAADRNSVHDDAIWRQMVKSEFDCASNWDKKWAFMKNAGPQNGKGKRKSKVDEDAIAGLDEACNEVALKSVFPVRKKLEAQLKCAETGIPVGIVVAAYGAQSVVKKAGAPLEKNTFPATTAQHHGWAWDATKIAQRDGADGEQGAPKVDPVLGVDIFKYNVRGRRDPHKWWGGARESLP